MNSISEQKKFLRKEIKQKKGLIDPYEAKRKASRVFAEIETLKEFNEANTILAFWALPDEIATQDFILKWSGQKRIVLPVVVGEELELRLFAGLEKLEQSNNFGIMEPKTGEIVSPSEIDFAIIPGVAFDKTGNRLGRGKGFYDRIMPQLKNILKVGIGYEFQLVDSIPIAEFDLPVDIVICN